MTDPTQQTETPDPAAPQTANGAGPTARASTSPGNLWTDLGPVGAWFIAYNLVRRFPENNGLLSKENAIYWATGVFMAATAAVIGWTLAKGRRPPPMLIITGVVVMVFGGLTLALQDPKFAYYKPTIINLLFAGAILGSLLVGRNIWKTAFEHAFNLPDHAWKIFALRWAAYYVFMAGLNELIWRNFSEDFWSNSKLFITIPLFIVFGALNVPFLMKHQIPDETQTPSNA
ncbi:MAG: inner membrane-spanning protein YciB [Hyphomonadaceae bacterium]